MSLVQIILNSISLVKSFKFKYHEPKEDHREEKFN